ncbi:MULTISPECIES: 4Fe-4S dicluster domain-containing protein [unclassified Adlercreutzia]|uniref:4Fe-4S dicluster domain-containing protein n=1 Tax=unclassified Adlercreutzia TaxID=2636013 RepID=UPI0013ED2448|nr:MULTISPECIES: 4Fe-4S dicluster domain-containing protein [unclassified Adlercreutzia]
MTYGLLFDYKWCTGCHSCEIACQQVHHFAPKKVGEQGKRGILPYEIGPYELAEDKYQYEFLPVPTSLCDHCKDRVEKGKLPSCVKHCQTACIEFGEIEELAKKMDSESMALFVVH